jgi:hypothetical protein
MEVVGMSKGQRAMAVAIRYPEHGTALSYQGCSRAYINKARRVLAEDPKLAKEVRDGLETLTKAYDTVKAAREKRATRYAEEDVVNVPGTPGDVWRVMVDRARRGDGATVVQPQSRIERPGVYILYQRGMPYYVGESKNMPRRIVSHLSDSKKDFDSYLFIDVGGGRSTRRYVENALICELDPPGNGKTGFNNGKNKRRCRILVGAGEYYVNQKTYTVEDAH